MPFNQRIGREIVPVDPSWDEATPGDRLAFFKEAGSRAVALKRGELARGIGANGRRMAPRRRPRPDGATGPVLTPHREDSRTARLMAAHATIESITLFWRSGHSKAQRLPWGTILGFHAAGEVKGAPVRDVRLSKSGQAQLRVAMGKWWEANHGRRLRQVRDDRIAAEQAAAKAARRKKPGMAAKAKKAIEKKYKGLAAYLNPRGGGF